MDNDLSVLDHVHRMHVKADHCVNVRVTKTDVRYFASIGCIWFPDLAYATNA